MIEGVRVYDLKSYPDEAGFFREIIRPDFLVRQISQSTKVTGASRGLHVYGKMDEVFYVSRGIVRFVMYDCRNNQEYLVSHPRVSDKPVVEKYGLHSLGGDKYQEVILSEYAPKAVLCPHGIAHGYTILQGAADILVIDSLTYDEVIEDEGHIDPLAFGNHWMRGVEVK